MPQVRSCRNGTGQELQHWNRSGITEIQQVRRCSFATATAAMEQVRNCRNATGQKLELCHRSGTAEIQQVRRCSFATGEELQKCETSGAAALQFQCGSGEMETLLTAFVCIQEGPEGCWPLGIFNISGSGVEEGLEQGCAVIFPEVSHEECVSPCSSSCVSRFVAVTQCREGWQQCPAFPLSCLPPNGDTGR